MGTATLTMSDEELARRAAGGDRRAFEGLVRRHLGRLLAFCRRLTGDEAEAEDRVQEAFLRAYQGLAGYDPSRRFSSWLTRIAQNACIDALRARKAWSPLVEEAPDRGAAGPLSQAILGEGTRALEDAVAELPPRQRAVLHRKYALGESAAEIAQALDMTPGNVRVVLHRAVRTLRARLNP